MDNTNLIVGAQLADISDNKPAPEKPNWFNQRLKEDLGELEGFPRYRVVWGQQAQAWREGQMRLKYVYAIFAEDRFHGVHVYNWRGTGQVKKLNFKEADSYQPRKGEIIVPEIEHFKKEIGDPFYWLEFYAPPSFYGTEEEWNKHRWIVTDDGHRIDLTGQYPAKGRYEPLLRLSMLNDDGTEEYRPLNDNTYDWIASMLKGDKVKLEQALKEQRTKLDFDAQEIFNDPAINREVENIAKHRVSIIVP